ncbi:hypothetical protein OXX79_009115, partial [Metschnikowia pulcherrima]
LLKSQTDLNVLSKTRTQSPPHSPYTAPSATASSTNMAAFAYTSASHHNQFTMTPVGESQEPDYFNQTAAPAPKQASKAAGTDSESEDEQTLSFGSKQNTSQTVQKDLSNKMHKLDIKPLTSTAKKQKKPQHQGDKLWQTMEKLTGPGRAILPSAENHPDRRLLAAKYKIFLEQCYKQQEYRKLVDEVEASA